MGFMACFSYTLRSGSHLHQSEGDPRPHRSTDPASSCLTGSLCAFFGFFVVSIESFGRFSPGLRRWFLATSDWPIPFSVPNPADLLMLLSMLSVLVYRFTRTRLHEETYERECAAARTVKQVLIPDALPKVPGFQIASVYRPFGEVGEISFRSFL